MLEVKADVEGLWLRLNVMVESKVVAPAGKKNG